jgi:hypothetical protein
MLTTVNNNYQKKQHDKNLKKNYKKYEEKREGKQLFY